MRFDKISWKPLCALAAAWLTCSSIRAQDLHFSQFNENPSLVNPALTGATSPVRASLCYRDQWSSLAGGYRTFGASVEKRFDFNKTKTIGPLGGIRRKKVNVSRLGAGLAAYTDKAGDAAMGHSRINLSLASFIPSGRKSYISMGLQASLVQRKIDQAKLLFPNQYNAGIYDPSKNSGETFSTTNFIYPDIGAGFLWSYAQDESRIAANDQVKANVGLSVYHLNRPAQKFLYSGYTLYRKLVLHGDMLICRASSNMAWSPAMILQFQGTSKEIIAGLMAKYFLKNESKYTGYVKRASLNYGAYYRNMDAVILCLMYEKEEQFAVGFSYDVNVSKLVTASSMRGGPEITIRYTPGGTYLYKPLPQY